MRPVQYDDLVRQICRERIQQALSPHPEWAAARVPSHPEHHGAGPFGRA